MAVLAAPWVHDTGALPSAANDVPSAATPAPVSPTPSPSESPGRTTPSSDAPIESTARLRIEPGGTVRITGSPTASETLDMGRRQVDFAERLAQPLQLQLPEGTRQLAPETWLPHLVPQDLESGAPVRLNREGFRAAIIDLARAVRLDPVNARLNVDDNGLTLLAPAAPGREVVTEELIDAIERQLPRDDRTVVVPLHTVHAPVRAETLADLGIHRVLGEGFTPYDRASGDRSFNIELAAARLNGLVIPPGSVFSFNRAIGSTSVEGGFRWGWGIATTGSGHRMVPSEAGGICQVATTLFQATFWSGLEVVERHPHTFWIENYGMEPYGRPGLDATVDDAGGYDFRFRNNTDGHLLIRALIRDAGLQIQILGNTPGWRVIVGEPAISQEVEADYAIIRQPTDRLPAGQERWLELAGPGFRSVLHRSVTDAAGQVILRDTFESTYAPSRNVLGVGRG